MVSSMVFGGQLAFGESRYAGTTLRVMMPKFPESLLWLEYAEEIAREWGMKLKVEYYTFDDIATKTLLDTAARITTWDIFYADDVIFGAFVKVGAATPIENYLTDPRIADPDVDWNDLTFVKDFVGDGTWSPKGMRWSFPNCASLGALVYRKDLINDPMEKAAFELRYGYELKVPETYKEFYVVAEFFTRKAGDTLAGKLLDHDFYGTTHSAKPGGFLWGDYADYMMAWGNPYIYDPKTMMPKWNSPENIAAAKYFISLKPFMPPGAGAMPSGESFGLFCEGRVFMAKEYMQRVFNLAEDPNTSKVIGKWDYTVTPNKIGSGVHHAAWGSSSSMLIWSHSKNKEAAYKLLERSASKEIVKRRAIESGDPPFRLSVMRDPEVIAARPMFRNWATVASPDNDLFNSSKIPEAIEIQDIAVTSLAEAWMGERTLEELFDRAQKDIMLLMIKAGYFLEKQ